ncbi:MAG: bacteriophage abortive infection AbiH family protein [Treponema sp.]|jgi:hypothetical protein|nr:bacteriophage abortive infection AbiH family protein [Treponema sp.]
MNRIILIGNGFDLAHGLKTSYKDFIDDYWEEKSNSFQYSYRIGKGEHIIDTSSSVLKYEDDDICISNIQRPDLSPFNIFKDIKEIGFNKFTRTLSLIDKDLIHNLQFKNKFLERITKETHLNNWVDIEEEYYAELTKLLESDYKEVVILNSEFSSIQKSLSDYLFKIKNNAKLSIIEENIYSASNTDTFVISPKDNVLKQILVLSFNYTSTELQYAYEKKDTKVIHIHGELTDKKNPIIFGYGDELDENYKKLEDKKDNNYLLYIKSFMYSRSWNYQDVLKFANSDQYEIFIMGHSCGNSDRTLLHTLFEHEHCLSIKIFYHSIDADNDNYLDLSMNISRSFEDKGKLRQILVPYPGCVPLS